MKEKINEYESVRNEIISMEETQRNVWIYMYVLFCTLFVLGLEWSHSLFLVSYIILIPFQCAINDYKWYINNMSLFIKVFFENEKDGISWETLHAYNLYKKFDAQKKKKIRNIIKNSGAIHLGFLATGFYCGYTLSNSFIDNKYVLELSNIFLIILSIVLFVVLVMLNKDYYKVQTPELEAIMVEYKKEREEDSVTDVDYNNKQ